MTPFERAAPGRAPRILGPVLVAMLAGLHACGPEGSEPAQVLLPVTAGPDAIQPCVNNLGWAITLTQARVALADLEFTIEGETHAALRPTSPRRPAPWRGLADLLVPTAIAHPGHQAGGQVTGSLDGAFLVDVIDGSTLGTATLLEGDYHGMNLAFRTAGPADGLEAGDPLIGHTAFLAGTAWRDGIDIAFTAVLDVAPGTMMVGGPFDMKVRPGMDAALVLTLYTIDPSEGDTLFDGLDFGALDTDGDGSIAIAPGPPAHNVLAKTLIRHDHWGIAVHQDPDKEAP